MIRRVCVIIIVLAVLLLISSCASFKPTDKTALLRSELYKWQNFSSEGVIRVNHEGLTLHKMFVLGKTSSEARLDVLDGGAFGINPSPLISVYLGEYVAIQSPVFPQLEMFAQVSIQPERYLKLLSDPDSLIALYGEEIVDTGKLVLNDTEISFSDRLRLSKITDGKSGLEITINYTSRGDPDKVYIFMDKSTSLELLVDRTSYGDVEISPLPQNEPSPMKDKLLETLEKMFPEEGDTDS